MLPCRSQISLIYRNVRPVVCPWLWLVSNLVQIPLAAQDGRLFVAGFPLMALPPLKLGMLLVHQGAISPADLRAALGRQADGIGIEQGCQAAPWTICLFILLRGDAPCPSQRRVISLWPRLIRQWSH
jgi:hypothetical protein